MLQPDQKNKLCLTCGKAIRGRSDKKFCSDACRNSLNNRLKGKSNNLVRNINGKLAKNRRVLEGLLPPKGTTTISKERLQSQGFQFKYITHLYTTAKGQTYFYCYDYGYLPLDNDRYLIVKTMGE
jgi:predicted nucleic acid-binding Zn ribbon protein